MISIKKGKTAVASARKKKPEEIKIDYLYLDLNTCDRCIGTDAVLEEVIDVLKDAFSLANLRLTYHKTEIATEADAVKHRFLSSPTIRVNGIDICAEVKESDCACCGDISGTQVDCRVFEYKGKLYTVPPKAFLAEAILKNAFLPSADNSAEEYILPENLKNFFNGKANKNSCC